MNYTENYHLPQWEKSDRIMMEDFNAAMGNLENAISAAQKTAEQAPFATGTYRGSGLVAQTITVGFRPSVVICFCNQCLTSSTDIVGRLFAGGEAVGSEQLEVTDTGFRLLPDNGKYPKANMSGYTYQYIAFR